MRGEVDGADTPDGRAVPRQPLLGFGAASAAQVDEELEESGTAVAEGHVVDS